MAGSQRAMALRCVLMGAAALLLATALVAGPVFTHGQAASIPLGNAAFAAQWNSIEPKVPNFWGPAYQNIFPEQYREATPNGQRFVQYFDKARMEQTTASGPVTNGLLTVELITGQRQFGDTLFTPYPPATIPIVGDPTNTFPTYASLGAGVFPNKAAQSAQPVGTVYSATGALSVDPQRAADPGAAFGSFQSDPGGKYAHNVPKAFWDYLTGLPVQWQTTMGFPLTEAFWVNVTLNKTLTWIMVQPFERRILSYTPTNKAGFQVEMGNIGQHYFQWRYTTNPGGIGGPATPTPLPTVAFSIANPCATPTPSPTATGTPSTATATTTATATPTATPFVCTTTPAPCATSTLTPLPTATGTFTTATDTPTATPLACTSATATSDIAGVEINNLRQTELTDTTFGLSFSTNLAATSYIRYGTTSGVYPAALDIATSPTTFHAITLTGLQPGTTYYFTIRVTSSVDAINRFEDFFTTTFTARPTPTNAPIATNTLPAPGGPPQVPTPTPGPPPPPKVCPSPPGPVPCRP